MSPIKIVTTSSLAGLTSILKHFKTNQYLKNTKILTHLTTKELHDTRERVYYITMERIEKKGDYDPDLKGHVDRH